MADTVLVDVHVTSVQHVHLCTHRNVKNKIEGSNETCFYIRMHIHIIGVCTCTYIPLP